MILLAFNSLYANIILSLYDVRHIDWHGIPLLVILGQVLAEPTAHPLLRSHNSTHTMSSNKNSLHENNAIACLFHDVEVHEAIQ